MELSKSPKEFRDILEEIKDENFSDENTFIKLCNKIIEIEDDEIKSEVLYIFSVNIFLNLNIEVESFNLIYNVIKSFKDDSVKTKFIQRIASSNGHNEEFLALILKSEPIDSQENLIVNYILSCNKTKNNIALILYVIKTGRVKFAFNIINIFASITDEERFSIIKQLLDSNCICNYDLIGSLITSFDNFDYVKSILLYYISNKKIVLTDNVISILYSKYYLSKEFSSLILLLKFLLNNESDEEKRKNIIASIDSLESFEKLKTPYPVAK